MLKEITKDQATAALRKMPFNLELSAARNETHRLALNDIDTGDTFTLTYDGVTSASISYNSTPATLASNIDTAIEGLSGWGAGTVSVVHVTGNTFDITYTGSKAALSINLPTITPTGFTPTGVTRTVTGGVINSPALGDTLSASDLQISKNGAAFTNTAGTVTEVGGGLYEYNPTVGEIDTEGYVVLSLNKTGLAAALFLYQINPVAAAINGETVIATGTAQGGSANSITLAAGASSVSNIFAGCRVDITSGTGAGQRGVGSVAYNGTTKVLTVEPAFVVVPDNTSVYKITSVMVTFAEQIRTNHTTDGTYGADLAEPSDIIDAFVARADEFADGILDTPDGVEINLTMRQTFRLLVAALAGKLAGAGSGTETFRNFNDDKNRIVASLDGDGNRLTITVDLS